MTHELFEVWKGTDGRWKLQLKGGIISYRLKRDAVSMSKACKEAN